MLDVVIRTARCTLLELKPEHVTERYLQWLRDPELQQHIMTAASTKELADLQRYVSERVGRTDVLFLGIFDAKSGEHIGNIKYEPIDEDLGFAIMGILIGVANYRGKGIGTEVLRASGSWLKRHRAVSEILLGVGAENLGAIKAYQKAGFVVTDSPHLPRQGSDTLVMVWRP